jgi:hypothetical protein
MFRMSAHLQHVFLHTQFVKSKLPEVKEQTVHTTHNHAVDARAQLRPLGRRRHAWQMSQQHRQDASNHAVNCMLPGLATLRSRTKVLNAIPKPQPTVEDTEELVQLALEPILAGALIHEARMGKRA